MADPRQSIQQEFGSLLTIEVDGEALGQAYELLEHYNLAIDSMAAFARYTGLARSTCWHLFRGSDDRLPWLRTLRKMSNFLIYHLGRVWGSSYKLTPEQIAEILLDSPTLKQELVRKLSRKPGRNE